MHAPSAPAKARKVPFATVIDFTVANLKNAMLLVRAHGLSQVQFCSRTDKGFHAQVYEDGVTFYASYSLPRKLGVRSRQTGKIQVGTLSLHTIAQARDRYLEVRRMAYAGIDPKAGLPEDQRYGDFYHQHYRQQCINSQKKSLKTDLQRYKCWIAPVFAHLSLSVIHVGHANQLVTKMLEAGRAASTIRNVVGQLSASLNLAVDMGVLSRNPVKGVKLPKIRNQRASTFTTEELIAFVIAARQREEIVASSLLLLLTFTGARLGEATHLKWKDLDLARGVWNLSDQKSGKAGVVYLSSAAIQVLMRVMPYRQSEYVFPGRKGNSVLSRPIRLFQRILKDARITAYRRIHDLRHAWCSQLIEDGVPIEVVSQGARHSSPVITRKYIHPHADVLLAANERLAQRLAA